MNKTEINWTDLTWNPTSGCYEVTPGCAFCYAKTLAEQRRGTPAFPVGFDPVEKPHKLREPLKVAEPSLIFTNSMSDLFLPEFSDAYRDRCFAIMAEATWHRFQTLTKRIELAEVYFATRKVPDNVWLGATVENLKDGVPRIAVLRRIAARVRFLSCEPLLGDLGADVDLSGIHWVIGGGESGNHLIDPDLLRRRGMVVRGGKGEPTYVPRADRYQWAQHLRDACARQGVAFWWKQWGGTRPKSGGRAIDGDEHNGMPVHVPGAMPSGRDGEVYEGRRVREQRLLPVVS